MEDETNPITESYVWQLLGNSAVNQAFAHLASGKVIERTRWADGSLAAFWDGRANAPEMQVHIDGNRILTGCSCGQSVSGKVCEHNAALLLAWAVQPGSFLEDDDEDDLFNDETDEIDGFFPALSPPGVAASGATVRPSSFDPAQEYRALLNNLILQQLREIARTRGIKLTGQRKEPIIETLAEALTRPESLAEAWSALSPSARRVVALFPFFDIPERGVEPKSVQKTARAMGLRSDQEVDNALQELKNLGIVFAKPFYGGLVVPTLLVSRLPPDGAFTAAYQDVAALKITPAPSPLEFSQLVTRLLLVLQAGRGQFRCRPKPEPHPVVKNLPFLSGWPYDSKEFDALVNERNPAHIWTRTFRVPPADSPLADDAQKSLLAAVGTDADRLDFILRLCAGLGILHINPGKPIEGIGENLIGLLQTEPLARAKMLFLAYTSLQTWTDLDLAAKRHKTFSLQRIAQLPAGASHSQMLELLCAARQVLLLQLRRQPAGRWTDYEALVEQARALPVNQNLWTHKSYWYPAPDGGKPDLNKPADWKAAYGAFAESVLSGPLYWMGIIECGYREGCLAAFRLTDFGAAIFGQNPDFQMPAPQNRGPALTFASADTLTLRAEAASAELVQLLILLGEAHANPRSEIAFRLTARGASRAFESGWDAERILVALESAAGRPPPDLLIESFKKWQQNFGSLHFYEDVALMEFSDDYALKELLAGASLSKYLLYRFSPRLIALRPEGVDTLREELVRKGYTPKVIA